MKTTNYIKSIITMTLSAVGFALVQSSVKFLGPSVSSWTKAFYRGLFGFVFLIIWLFIIRKKPVFNNKFLLVVRGIAGAFGLVFSFWAIDLVDLSHATIYLYT
ncbi:MAG: EamA family transporter, partial [Spirochaetes bacterium]|nr:EamA family transporter [Spirochaetota bacterium]